MGFLAWIVVLLVGSSGVRAGFDCRVNRFLSHTTPDERACELIRKWTQSYFPTGLCDPKYRATTSDLFDRLPFFVTLASPTCPQTQSPAPSWSHVSAPPSNTRLDHRLEGSACHQTLSVASGSTSVGGCARAGYPVATTDPTIFEAPPSDARTRDVYFEADNWVVDRRCPTADTAGCPRLAPNLIPKQHLETMNLINGQFPGPTITVWEGDRVRIHLKNSMEGDVCTIHVHGQWQRGTPWADGTSMVAQAPVRPHESMVLEFLAEPAGTHWWHDHSDGNNMVKGMLGSFIVLKRQDPYRSWYDEDRIVMLSDALTDWERCELLEGPSHATMWKSPGDYACTVPSAPIAINGVTGRGTRDHPFASIDVEANRCYRFRFTLGTHQREQASVEFEGATTMTVISQDGIDVEPYETTVLPIMLGGRTDAVVCVDESMLGSVIRFRDSSVCGINAVKPWPCVTFAVLQAPRTVQEPRYEQESDHPTDGWLDPRRTEREERGITRFLRSLAPMQRMPSTKPARTHRLHIGLRNDEWSDPTQPQRTIHPWYVDVARPGRSYQAPSTPWLHTEAQCGASQGPVLRIDDGVVDLVLHNLTPIFHMFHIHGFHVWLIATGAKMNGTIGVPTPFDEAPCPVLLSDPTYPALGAPAAPGAYWGCASEGASEERFPTPVAVDTIPVAAHNWVRVRLFNNNPGMWPFHCHVHPHMKSGMRMVLHMPSHSPIPKTIPTQGPCTKWNRVWEACTSRPVNWTYCKFSLRHSKDIRPRDLIPLRQNYITES